MASLRVTGLDHLVLRVADVERSLAFYCGALGLEGVRVEEWRSGNVPFPSVRIDRSTILDVLEAETGGGERLNLDHFCLVVDAPHDVERLRRVFDVIDGPAPRFGARGVATSVYVRDPDANTVELRYYD